MGCRRSRASCPSPYPGGRWCERGGERPLSGLYAPELGAASGARLPFGEGAMMVLRAVGGFRAIRQERPGWNAVVFRRQRWRRRTGRDPGWIPRSDRARPTRTDRAGDGNLADEFRLIFVDHRGHGLSDKPHDASGVCDADASRETSSRCSTTSASRRSHFIGISWGGRLCFGIGEHAPEPHPLARDDRAAVLRDRPRRSARPRRGGGAGRLQEARHRRTRGSVRGDHRAIPRTVREVYLACDAAGDARRVASCDG